MTPITVTIELDHNKRVIDGINALEDHWTTDYGFSVHPQSNGKDQVVVTLSDLDYGRYDAEGYRYLYELLNIVPGDFQAAWIVEEDY